MNIGNGDLVEILIQNGANVNAVDSMDLSPLHYAVRSGQEVAAEVLIRNGANVNAMDKDFLTPLHWSVRGGMDYSIDKLTNY